MKLGYLKNDARSILEQLRDYEKAIAKDDLEELKVLRDTFIPKLGIVRLVADFLHKSLPKLPVVQKFGNWESDLLSRKQIMYAASDAAAVFDVTLKVLEKCEMHELECLVEEPFKPKEIKLLLLELVFRMTSEYSLIVPDYLASEGEQITSNQKCGRELAETLAMVALLILASSTVIPLIFRAFRK